MSRCLTPLARNAVKTRPYLIVGSALAVLIIGLTISAVVASIQKSIRAKEDADRTLYLSWSSEMGYEFSYDVYFRLMYRGQLPTVPKNLSEPSNKPKQ